MRELVKKGFFTTSDKARIYYEDRGEGDPILFVPGHMCTTKFYIKNAEELGKTHRVLCIDNRGFGSSSKPLHGNDVERHADDIKELIDYLGLKNVMLLGWSLSGSIVVTYAHKYKCHALKGLGLIDACLFPFSPEDWNTYNCKNYDMDAWNKKYLLWHTDIEQYVNNFVSRMDEYLSSEEVQTVKDEIMKTPPWIGFALHSDWIHTNADRLLKDITVPVIIFSGQSLGHGYAMGRHYKKEVRTYCELHEYDKGGHLLFYVEHETFNRQLREFLAKIG
ncbi:MAG: alpha/beta hydrolase [Pyramidobacter sp.]|nr:alpha/beta hydrolase [Pyramidobacter sp.]